MTIQGGLLLRTLLIECATNTAIISVRNGDVFAQRTSPDKGSHSVKLFQLVDEALAECGITIRDITLIVAGIGPGSFTGIRIAVASARMIAQVLDVPIIGLDTQMIYAAGAGGAPDDSVLVAFDAKKDRIFAALYSIKTDSTPAEIVNPGDYYPEELTGHFPNTGRTIMIGDGAERYEEIFSAHANDPLLIRSFVPDTLRAITIAEKMVAENPARYTDPASVIPHYARKSDAEIASTRKNF
jgi:tRNA threonylcarbamoyladenosine biosynthesis protein TsaB